ncbi:hypothetical protein Aduo_015030 [Ancylostoma duodenale]
MSIEVSYLDKLDISLNLVSSFIQDVEPFFSGRKKCGKNEEYHSFSVSDSCYPNCKHPSPIECPAGEVKDICHCKPGFFRDSKGNCVKDCFHEPCYDPNAIRKTCGVPQHCQPSCKERKPPLCENKSCLKNACECKPGFVLDFYTLYCIPVSDCEKPTTPGTFRSLNETSRQRIVKLFRRVFAEKWKYGKQRNSEMIQ